MGWNHQLDLVRHPPHMGYIEIKHQMINDCLEDHPSYPTGNEESYPTKREKENHRLKIAISGDMLVPRRVVSS